MSEALGLMSEHSLRRKAWSSLSSFSSMRVAARHEPSFETSKDNMMISV